MNKFSFFYLSIYLCKII